MPSNVKILGIAIGVAACVFGTAAAFAQDTPARVRGTLDKMDGNNLTIQTRNGKKPPSRSRTVLQWSRSRRGRCRI